jgi:rhodanese-related sulfurtransferase
MNFVQNNWMLLLVFILSGAMLLWPLIQRRLAPGKELGTHQATRLINDRDALLLDVRETNEYEGGHLPHAVHIPLSQLPSRGAEIGKYTARPVIVYCARGNRSRMAGAALAKLGFGEVYQLAGGYEGWRAAGLPTEK